jgi:FKBP-type peptidyl-prolyl cis-trans isomerases 2
VGAVGGGLVEHDVGDDDLGMRVQLGAQRLAEVGHLVEVGDVAVVDPLHHLVGTELLFAEDLDEEALQPATVQFEQVLAHGHGRGDGVAGGGHAGNRLQTGHVLLPCAQRETTSVAAKK